MASAASARATGSDQVVDKRVLPRPSVSGGHLVWGVAVAMAVVSYAVAIDSQRALLLLAAGLSLALPLLFAWRLEAGVLVVVLVRPSLDLFAERTLASFHGFQLNPASVLAVLLIAIGVPYMVERAHALRRAPSVYPYLAFAAIAAISIAVAPAKGYATTEWLRMSSMLVLYALAFLAASSRAAVARLMGAILLSAVVPVTAGLLQLARGGARTIGDYHRLTGTFLHPDPYGIYLGLIVVAAITVVLSGRAPWRWFAVLLVLAGGAALFGSYTRTGWVMVGFGLLVLGVARYRWLLLLTPIAAVVVLTVIPSAGGRFNDIANPQQKTYGPGNSFQGRIDLWRENLPAAKAKPITGRGLGYIVETGADSAHVHSDYVRALVETGVFGFIAYVAVLLSGLIASIAAYTRARRSQSRALRTAALAGVACGACYLLASGDSNLMSQVAVSGTAWALFACAHAAGRLAAQERSLPVLTPTEERFARIRASRGVRLGAVVGSPT